MLIIYKTYNIICNVIKILSKIKVFYDVDDEIH